MTGLVVDPRDRIMDADHRRKRIEAFPVEHEGIGQPAVGQQRIRQEEPSPGQVLGAIFERAQRVLGDRVVGVTERKPTSGELRSKLSHSAQLADGVHVPPDCRVRRRQHLPLLEIRRDCRHRALQGRDRLLRLAQREIARPEEQLRRDQRRLQRCGALERRNRVGFATAHRERHSKIHEQSRIVGERLQEFAIDPRGLFESALLHGT